MENRGKPEGGCFVCVLRIVTVASLALLIACSGSDPASPPAPTSVELVNASATKTATEYDDHLTVTLRNDGGPGDFYLDFWGFSTVDPSVCYEQPDGSCQYRQIEVGTSDPVNVTDGYSETVTYTVTNAQVASVRVMSRPLNSATYAMTSCKVVRSYDASFVASCP